MSATVRIVIRPDAEHTVEQIAAPKLEDVAGRIAPAILANVPVHHGGARATYKTTVEGGGESGGHPQAKVNIGSPFWHFLEYGTAFSPPYRPIQNACTGLGLRYVPK